MASVTGVLNATANAAANAAVQAVNSTDPGSGNGNGGGNIFVPTNPPQKDTLTLSDDAKKLLNSNKQN